MRLTSKGELRLRIQYSKGKAFVDKISIGTKADLEAMGIEDINSPENGCDFMVYSVAGAQVGKISAADNEDAIRQIREITNANGVFLIKNVASGEAKKVMVK